MQNTHRRMRPSPVRRTPQEETPAPTLPPMKAARRFHWDRAPLAAFGYFILLLWWIAGGKWTIDGSPLLINAVFDFLHIPAVLPPVRHYAVYAFLCWLPIGISVVEHRYAPWRGLREWSILALVYVMLVWFVVTGVDWSSTFLALTNPEPGAWRIAHEVAARPILAALWTTLTTFAPEIGFAVLTWWLWEPNNGKHRA